MSAARVGPLASRLTPASASPNAKLRMPERVAPMFLFSGGSGAVIVGRLQRVHKWLSGLEVLYGYGHVAGLPGGLKTSLLRGGFGLAALGLQRCRQAEQRPRVVG